MFKNYIVIAARNLWKNKIFSLINVAGLAIGISAALVIYLIVHHELSFDKFERDGDRIYRVVSQIEFPGMTGHYYGVPDPTGNAVRQEVTGLAGVTHFVTLYRAKVSVPATGSGAPIVFKQQKSILYADTAYFKMFDYRWLAGSPEIALADPFRVVLAESRAKTYFGNIPYSDMMGRQVTYDDSITVTVSGIVEDLDEVTDFTFSEFVSFGTVEHTGLKDRWAQDGWGSINSASQLFLKLLPGISPKQVEQQLVVLRSKHLDKKETKDNTQHFLQPLSAIHFDPDYGGFDGSHIVDKSSLYGLLGVALLLLFLGCVNFINLTTAAASQRAKEIGIRKTLGSSVKQLMFQFLGETFLLTLLATLLSVALTPLLLDLFKDLLPQGISLSSLFQAHVWIFLVCLTAGVSVLSGTYPAFVLTRFQPITILRNQVFTTRSATRSAWFRKTLTVAQLVIAQFLIIAAIVVSKQIYYSLHKDLGYSKDAIVYFYVPNDFFLNKQDDRRFTLVDRLRSIPEITKISLAGPPPASPATMRNSMKVNNGKSIVETMVEVKYADTSYFDLYKMNLVAGKNLQESDTIKEYVINETYARFLGFSNPEEVLGHFVEDRPNIPIVGVVADFHTKSTHQPIKPLALTATAKRSYCIHLALRPGDVPSWRTALAKTEKEFKRIFPDKDFDAQYFDETVAAFYKTEENVSGLLRWATGLAMFISCLGLLGLVIYTTNTRTKEIGVRKVLGASVTEIVALLSKDFLSLVLAAFLVASPVGWWVMRRWLEDFSYRTSITWWVFALSGFVMVLVALLTLSVRTIRSASANPVESLRTE